MYPVNLHNEGASKIHLKSWPLEQSALQRWAYTAWFYYSYWLKTGKMACKV
jgi:hypothetical protein